MNNTHNAFRKSALALALALAGLLPASASAADGDAEARIQRLEQQVQELLQALEAQKTALGQQQLVVENIAPAKGAVVATTNSRALSFKSLDGDYAFQVGGRVQADAAFYDADDNEFGDGTAVRRAFLDIRGTVAKDWSYRFQYDFARPSGSDPSSRGIRDAWIQYAGLEAGKVTVGNFKQYFGLEALMSNLSTTFIERGVTDLFNPDRRVGGGFSTAGSNWTGALGVFGERAEGDAADEGDEGWDLAGRVTFAPVLQADRVVHLGFAGRYHKPENSVTELRFRSRAESNITSIRLVDTGVVADVDDFVSLGLEAAAFFGPFSVQSEYINTSLSRSQGGDVDLSAWYAYASYFLTGESRTYRADTAIFDRPRVAAPVRSGGGFGAWEIGLRYSSADLTDANIVGGKLDNLTLGLNWYALDNLRFSANYIKVLDVDRPGSIYDNQDLDTLALRAQIDF